MIDRKRLWAISLVLVVFAANYFEILAGHWARKRAYLDAGRPYQVAHAFHNFEGTAGLERQNDINRVTIIGYSVSYFFVFPVLVLAVAIALARRAESRPFELYCRAVAIDYLLSVPFFLLFPVVERWADPNGSASLLSDLWHSELITWFRPISGLENSFPSFHVSLTTVFVILGYLFRLRMRTTILFLGATVILSTFALGVHWLFDISAGLGLGSVSVWIAARISRHRPALA